MPTAAANVDVVVTAKTIGYTAQMRAAERQMTLLKTRTGEMQAASSSFARHGVTDMQAVSGSLRLFEGGLNRSLRTMERFVSQSKVASKVALMAFPAVGAVALGYMLGKIIGEVSEFIDKMNAVPTAIRNGFQSINTSAQTANDSLQLTNDKIQASLDKLSGKPGDGLNIALDEAKVRADRLATSLAGVLSKMNDLMQQQHISYLGGLVTGQDSTNRESGTFKSYNQQIRDADYTYKDAVRSNDPKNIASTKKALVDLLNSAIQKTSSELGAYHRMATIFPGTASGFQGNVEMLRGLHEGYAQTLDSINEDSDNASLTKKQSAAEGSKTKVEAGKEAAAKLKAAQESISRVQIEAMNQAHQAFDAVANRTAADEATYWQSRLVTLKNGSAAYLEAVRNYQASMRQVQHENATGRDRFSNTANSIASDGANRSAMTPDNQRYFQDQSKATASWAKNMNDARAIHVGNNSAMAEANIQYQHSTGRMSDHGAAMADAALHAQAYADALRSLDEAIAAVNADGSLSPVERNARLSGLRNQGLSMQGQQAQQALQDKYAIEQTSIYGSLTIALRQFAGATTNAGQVLTGLAMNALQSVNGAVIASAQGGHGAFKGLGRNLIGQGEGALLTGVEGYGIRALSSLTGGKLGAHGKLGTASNPMVVRDVNASKSGNLSKSLTPQIQASNIMQGVTHPMSGIKSVVGGIGSMFKGGGGIGSIFGSLFQGFFAGGGDVVSNRPAIIGERGPEMFIPKSAGRIVPNHQLGGSQQQTINIDARQTNPAMVQTAVHRGMTMAYAGAVQTSAKQHRDTSRRRP